MGVPLARVDAQRECVEVERESRVMEFAGRRPCWTDGEGGALQAECVFQSGRTAGRHTGW